MPTYTLAEQRAETLRRLRAADTSRFSSTGGTADYGWIDGAIERAEEDFVRTTKCLRTYAVIQLKASQRLYRAPSDMIDIMAAYYYDSSLSDGYKELVFTTPEKLNDEESDWRTETGEPGKIYIDRQRNDLVTIGLYPIPATDGGTISYTNSNASEVTWICPLYEVRWDFGRIIRYNSADSFILSSSETALVDAEPGNKNLLIEYYRLPYQKGEVPKESMKAISMYAAADLLADNPEDSAEYKRSATLMQQFAAEVMVYINRRKRPLAGQELRATPAVWGWQKSMTYYKEIA